jgi:hypothetical protein
MRDFESMSVLRTNASRTVWPEIYSGRLLAENAELPRPVVGRGSRSELLEIGQEGCVDTVNSLGVGLGRTG